MRTSNFISATLAVAASMPAAVRADPLSYGYAQKDFFAAHPEGVAYGRGGTTELSYDISDNAFYYLDGLAESTSPGRERRYDLGVGINSSSADSGVSFYATVGWNHVGFDPVVGPPGKADHGYGASLGLRAQLAEDWEFFAQAREDHNDVLAAESSGSFGLWYTFIHKWQVGASVITSSKESDYVLSIRAFF
jgi:hypothetical protein